MMPSNNNYAARVYGSLQWNAARFCSTESLASNPNPLRWDVCFWPRLCENSGLKASIGSRSRSRAFREPVHR